VFRNWLLTWTTYGTWLPGDPRGSDTSVREGHEPRIEHDVPGTPCDASMPGLYRSAMTAMKAEPILLISDQAALLLDQFRQTSTYRGWQLRGCAIVPNHMNLVVIVPGDPDPSSLVRDFKSYGSRALNRKWGKPASETWWSGGGGSKRKLPNDTAVRQALGYLQRQAHPLLIWIAADDPADMT
jgi:REP element-mobilizing transposase RayT